MQRGKERGLGFGLRIIRLFIFSSFIFLLPPPHTPFTFVLINLCCCAIPLVLEVNFFTQSGSRWVISGDFYGQKRDGSPVSHKAQLPDPLLKGDRRRLRAGSGGGWGFLKPALHPKRSSLVWEHIREWSCDPQNQLRLQHLVGNLCTLKGLRVADLCFNLPHGWSSQNQ